MLWGVDPSSEAPLFEQIAASVRGALADGSIGVGEKLPPAAQLADALEVNMHTVLRAYQMLRDEGLIELRRGRGAVVLDQAVESAHLGAMADHLLKEAARLGLSRADVIAMIEERS